MTGRIRSFGGQAALQSESRRTGAEGNVYDGFEVNWFAMLFRGLKLPLRESFHGIGVEVGLHAVHQLDAVHGAVLADYGVEDYLSLHMRGAQFGRIFRIDLAQRDGPRKA